MELRTPTTAEKFENISNESIQTIASELTAYVEYREEEKNIDVIDDYDVVYDIFESHFNEFLNNFDDALIEDNETYFLNNGDDESDDDLEDVHNEIKHQATLNIFGTISTPRKKEIEYNVNTLDNLFFYVNLFNLTTYDEVLFFINNTLDKKKINLFNKQLNIAQEFVIKTTSDEQEGLMIIKNYKASSKAIFNNFNCQVKYEILSKPSGENGMRLFLTTAFYDSVINNGKPKKITKRNAPDNLMVILYNRLSDERQIYTN